jgi:hypothetical protein
VDAASTPLVPIGSVLVDRGLVGERDLQRALTEQSRTGRRLGEILVGWGMITWLALAEALAAQWPHPSPSGHGGEAAEASVLRVGAASAPSLVVVPDPEPEPEPDPRQEVAELVGALEGLREEVARTHDEIDRLRGELHAQEPEAAAEDVPDDGPFLLFALAGGTYTVVERRGPVPPVGAEVGVAGAEGRFSVVKVGRSPFPGDDRRCAYLQPSS